MNPDTLNTFKDPECLKRYTDWGYGLDGQEAAVIFSARGQCPYRVCDPVSHLRGEFYCLLILSNCVTLYYARLD
jgi:hypothetical protein